MTDQGSHSLVCAWVKQGDASPGLAVTPKKKGCWWSQLISVVGNPIGGARQPAPQHSQSQSSLGASLKAMFKCALDHASCVHCKAKRFGSQQTTATIQLKPGVGASCPAERRV